MEADTRTWRWKIQGTRIEGFLQTTVLPNVGIIRRSWLPHINKEKIVVGVHKSKQHNAEFALVIVEKAAWNEKDIAF